jgi:hypothetical protein
MAEIDRAAIESDHQKATQPQSARSDSKPNVIADAADIASLWVGTDVGDPLTTEHVNFVPIGRPKDFFRTHPDLGYRRRCEIYVHKSENIIGTEYYLIGPAMRGRIEEARPCVIVTVVDRLGMPRLWPLIEPRAGEQDNPAWVSSRRIAREGLSAWVRAVWKERIFISRIADDGYAPTPEFNRLQPFEDLVRLAFGEHGIVRDENHPVYRDLFGKAGPGDDDPLL